MKTTKVKMIIAFVMSFALIISTLAVTPPQEAKATYMPLERVRNLRVDLSDMFPEEMAAVPINTILSRLEDSSGNPVSIEGHALAYYFSSSPWRYYVIGEDGMVNLTGYKTSSPFQGSYNLYGFTIIAGNAVDQLNLSNKEYEISIVSPPAYGLISSELYSDTNKNVIPSKDGVSYGINDLHLFPHIDRTRWDEVTPVYIKFKSAYIGKPNVDVTAYKGLFYSENEITSGAEDVTADVIADNGIGVMVDPKDSSTSRFTIVMTREDRKLIIPITIHLLLENYSFGASNVYKDSTHQNLVSYTYSSWSNSSDNYLWHEDYSLRGNIDISSVYVTFYASSSVYGDMDYSEIVTKAVVGLFDNLSDAESETDIKDEMFGIGYRTDYSRGVPFTVFFKNGSVEQRMVTLTIYDSTSAKTELSVEAYDSPNRVFSVQVTSGMDSYVENGFLASLFLYGDGLPGQMTYFGAATSGAITIKPRFYASENAKVYASQDGNSAVLQESGVSEIIYYEDKPVHYTVKSGDEEAEKNYLVSFVSQQSGPKLYVHGLTDEMSYVTEGNALVPTREVILTDTGYHDVFIANIGSEDIEGLYVRLEDAQNVKIDDYWRIGDTKKLSAFTEPGSWNYNKSFAKVRLVHDGTAGMVSGTLVIGYIGDGSNGEEIRIKLSGISGDAKIITQNMVDAVKYVPYSTVIQNSVMTSGNSSVTYRLSGGRLPDGFILKPNGEIYGIPTETTMEYDEEVDEYVDVPYSFEVTMEYTYRSRYYDRVIKSTDKKNYTLYIRDNTKENIEEINNNPEMGYKVLDYVPEEVDIATASGAGIEFRTEGAFSDYRDLYIDGQKMTRDTDYSAEEGSTKITIYNKTFANIGVGEHTISAVFRDNNADDGTLKTSNQLFKVTRKTTPSPSYSGGDSSSSTSDISDAEENNEKKETKNGDGSVTTTTEKKNKDGSTTTISETKNKNGSVETKSVTKALDGSETIETKVTNKDGSTSSEKVVKDKDGNILSTKTTSDHTKKDGTKITESQTVKADGTGGYKKKETMPSGRTETTTAKMKEDGSIDASVSIKTAAGVKITKNYEVNEDGSLTLTKVKTKNKTAVIPASVTLFGKKYKVTSVSPNAFKGNKSITKVKIGKNITSIDLNAFKNASNLGTIIIRSSDIKEVAANAFKGIASGAVFKFEMSKKDFKRMKEIFEAIVPKDAILKRTEKK